VRDYDLDDFKRPPTFEGLAPASDDGLGLQNAIADAVNKAGQPHGTWLRVLSIEVVSVDDPNVGGYRVELGPTG